MPISNLYDEYAQLDAQLKALELKKEQLRPHVLKMMLEDGEKEKDIGVGKFVITSTKTWTYPEHVTAIKDQFDAAKAKAQSTGEATCEETPNFKFNVAKL